MTQSERGTNFSGHRFMLKMAAAVGLGIVLAPVITDAYEGLKRVQRQTVTTEFEPDDCEGCATGDSYEELMRAYPELGDRPVRVQKILTEYSQSTVYNAARIKFDRQQATDLIAFYEQLAASRTQLDILTWYRQAEQFNLEPTQFKQHIFFIVDRAEATSTTSGYAIRPSIEVFTWFDIGNGSTQTTIPVDRGMPVDDSYGVKYRSAVERANAMFAVGACDAVLTPFDVKDANKRDSFGQVCSLMGRRVIYSDVKKSFGIDTLSTLNRYTQKSDENRWDRIFQGQPGRGYVFREK
ncbi:hypothetical protein A2627_01435 [Candidatus Woesebacteria bacterium RIFCSPHIGHO2_01_FULL_39_28]|uniref:Uncharacterized protein n=1 Tax=Candidatus Woesebacteria bacterium RIFCSPHIGHO2_01_FULL_39_28 TaxID=1802496 RepID=A0A1F7YJ86_9BACT|nr:MAG: hypothetical protein A2627_01435 [Candidatus Woesebacteria bacterium RIFCSPHIGHO2_01_FULL_39_28]OGM57633.1 MAG: hypothetical protein A3A50_01335 [Candidatus Woesebacteria bacterium RIFCSPLOWO2_01_FULL_38_20]